MSQQASLHQIEESEVSTEDTVLSLIDESMESLEELVYPTEVNIYLNS